MEEAMKKLFVPCLLALTLSACATRPEKIEAASISQDPYLGSDCAQLASTMESARVDLKKFSDLQDSSANKDAVSVFWVGIPVSWFLGDHQKEVAKSKGEVAAIDAALRLKGCKQLKA
jgi:hypothetical protein